MDFASAQREQETQETLRSAGGICGGSEKNNLRFKNLFVSLQSFVQGTVVCKNV